MAFYSILITGASSGIGAALAEHYAASGVRLALLARNQEHLAEIEAKVRACGAESVIALCDVRNRQAMARQIIAWDEERPFDLAIANAGISAGIGEHGESEAQLRAIAATNIEGVINSIAPLTPRFIARRHGHIALMASLAGYRGLPGAPAYCASKAWVKTYGEALRYDLARHSVGVSVICPGFIATPMTAKNQFPMPFSLPADKAAAIIAQGLAANRALIAFPIPMRLAAWLLSALPQTLFGFLARHMPQKKSDA